jgi:hypothetical protein
MKAYGGMDVQIHVFLTLALAGGEWSASWPGHFTLGEKAPVPAGQEVGWTPGPVWTMLGRENFRPYQDTNSDPLVVQPVASHYAYYAILAFWYVHSC